MIRHYLKILSKLNGRFSLGNLIHLNMKLKIHFKKTSVTKNYEDLHLLEDLVFSGY
jgi:hypothetical protein